MAVDGKVVEKRRVVAIGERGGQVVRGPGIRVTIELSVKSREESPAVHVAPLERASLGDLELALVGHETLAVPAAGRHHDCLGLEIDGEGSVPHDGEEPGCPAVVSAPDQSHELPPIHAGGTGARQRRAGLFAGQVKRETRGVARSDDGRVGGPRVRNGIRVGRRIRRREGAPVRAAAADEERGDQHSGDRKNK